MEISGKILREVEFRDRLRGYDTDEVDEFLEKMAGAVDELIAEVALLKERAEKAEAQAEEHPVDDDDAIRRTLILAQRTADLAIKEAKEHAASLLEEAHREAERVTLEASDAARRVREEADNEVHERFDRLVDQREEMERQIASLTDLISSERSRLSDSLGNLSQLVSETLNVSEEFARRVPRDRHPVATEARSRLSEVLGDVDDLGLSEVEAEIRDDAKTPLPPEPEATFPTESGVLDNGNFEAEDELWARWANTGESPDDDPNDSTRFRPGGDRSA